MALGEQRKEESLALPEASRKLGSSIVSEEQNKSGLGCASMAKYIPSIPKALGSTSHLPLPKDPMFTPKNKSVYKENYHTWNLLQND